MTRVVFTGGGTAGHVTPNIALIDALKKEKPDCDIHYVGSPDGVERQMITELNIPYHAVRSGKLRRYFSLKNFLDPFNLLWGLIQSYVLLHRLKPSIVFSKGGFVAFPVVVAAWLHRIPVIAHESDLSPGLANRLSYPFVKTICVTFAAAKTYFKHQEKVDVTGTPIRAELLQGHRTEGLALCGFYSDKPCLLVMGGSQGSRALNRVVRAALDDLTHQFQVIHICGQGNIDETFLKRPDYCQFDYVNEGLADLFAATDVVVSRAGANSLYELLVLNLPHVLVPLSLQSSRGDQIQNAKFFEKEGVSTVIDEQALTPERFIKAVNEVYLKREEIANKIRALQIGSATEVILNKICAYL
ncbi:MAG: undecaprenyldiphospho-muramoylpentapeptide beta-N-acetylglucosaminyltransferase [Legionellaceae bacterium]